MTKLAICVPARDSVSTRFTFCLTQLTNNLVRQNIDFELFIDINSVLPAQRHTLVEKAQVANATHILWLDSDMIFPASIANTLLEHNKDIVACTYSTRHHPPKSVAFMSDNDSNKRLEHTTGLHKVNSVGMGIMLTSIHVFDEIPKPWFSFVYDSYTNSYSGEDIFFCTNARDSGYEIYVDADTSNKCGHEGTKVFTMDNIT